MKSDYLTTLAAETAHALDRAGLQRSATELRALPLPSAGPGWVYTWCSTIAAVTAFAGTVERKLREHGQPAGNAGDALCLCWRLMAAFCNEVESDLRGRAA